MKLEETMPGANDMQNVKRRFFALRNGVIADVLRRAGSPHAVIFGLTLPQIAEVAQATGQSAELALQLWQNSTTRESRLLAPYLMPAEQVDDDLAMSWAQTVQCPEEADVLCHRLLRKLDYDKAQRIIEDLALSDVPLHRYTALRLAFNLLAKDPQKARKLAEAELENADALTRSVAKMMLQEADYLISAR